MTKKRIMLLLPPLLGLIGAVVRFVQCGVVFEEETGLARPHALSAVLPVYLLAAAVFFAVAAWKSKGKNLSWEEVFCPLSPSLLPLFVCAAMLYVVSGGCLLLSSLGGGEVLPLLLGAMAAVGGGALFFAVRTWRSGGAPGTALLLPMLFAVVWLLITYQDCAANPVVTAFYVQVLAQAAAAYAFYHLAACGFSKGSRCVLRWILPVAVVLSFTALADGVDLPIRGMHLASLLSLLGFWLCEKA